MKVKELLAELAKCDPECEVILQRDAEGNGYSPLHVADPDAVYVPDTTWGGTAYSIDNSADDNCMDEDEWQELLSGPRCVVLAPVN